MIRAAFWIAVAQSLLIGCIYQDECTEAAVEIDGECRLRGDESADAGPDGATDADAGEPPLDGGDDSGASIDASGDACAAGQRACEGGCTDVSSDRDNCGECGTTCDWGCVDGTCETVEDIEAAILHTCVLMDSGSAYCWGANSLGQLGDGTTDEVRAVPGRAAAGVGPLVDLSATALHACAENESGEMYCWGANGDGQLGRASPAASPDPLLNDSITNPTQLAAGFAFTCALVAPYTKCWGANGRHELGDGTTDDSLTPVTVAGVGGGSALDLTFVSAGDHHACGLGAGEVYCWGDNEGRLGNGTIGETPDRVQVSGVEDAVQIETGRSHNCARRLGGEVQCWGFNEFGQIGDGTDSSTGVDVRAAPVPVSGLTDAIDVAAGAEHSCAIRAEGQVVCWGKNDFGQLGNGTTTNSNVPVAVPGLDDATQLSLGQGDHSCALRSTGELVCWGRNDYGQLGDGGSGAGEYRASPEAVMLP